MTRAEFESCFPNASDETLRQNGFAVPAPQCGGTASRAEDIGRGDLPQSAKLGRAKCRKAMNKTEGRYSLILEGMKTAGKIVRWDFEGVTLRTGPRRYTPDFFIIFPSGKMGFREVKGPFVRPDSALKFDLFKAAWPEFDFEMWQFKEKHWTRIL